MERPFFSARYLVLLFVAFAFGTTSVAPQKSALSPHAGSVAAHQQGIYLVFPFENAGASPRLDWLSEGLEELTIQRLSAAGEQVYSHAGRLAELERNGLLPSSKLRPPTTLHIGQDLHVDFAAFAQS